MLIVNLFFQCLECKVFFPLASNLVNHQTRTGHSNGKINYFLRRFKMCFEFMFLTVIFRIFSTFQMKNLTWKTATTAAVSNKTKKKQFFPQKSWKSSSGLEVTAASSALTPSTTWSLTSTTPTSSTRMTSAKNGSSASAVSCTTTAKKLTGHL